jgi:DegV family protein with EDD domain
MCRFHLHCIDPAKVLESVVDAGRITHTKADDMIRQFQMIHQRKFPIALVTDSSADIPQTFLEEHQIHIIHLNMHLDGHNLLDRIFINPDNFYDRLANLKTYPKTSFPSPALIAEQMKQLSQHYEHVLVLPLAQALSGTHDAIVKATEQIANIHVLDSCQTSGGLGLLVAFAARLIAQGLPIEDIKRKMLLKIPNVNLVVYVASFESMIRSGRISKLRGRIAEFANVKPIISLNETGKGVVCGKAFSEIKALSKLVTHVEFSRKTQALDTYGLVHAGVPEKALEFAQLTTEAFGQPPAFIESASTALGLHAGRGSIALAYMMK